MHYQQDSSWPPAHVIRLDDDVLGEDIDLRKSFYNLNLSPGNINVTPKSWINDAWQASNQNEIVIIWH